MFEIDSTFHPGVGGAVFLNLDGEAIGLTTATAAIPSDAGLAFAMPIDDNLLRIIEVLGRGEEVEYGFLGVTRPEPFRRGRGRGLHLDRGPLRNSPAFAAGLRVDDLITRINDHPVNSFEDLLLQIGSGLAGRKLKTALQARRPAARSRGATREVPQSDAVHRVGAAGADLRPPRRLFERDGAGRSLTRSAADW